MAKRHEELAKRQSLAEQARLAWYKTRIANVHASVSTYDILRRHGVELKHGDDREEQFSCPFHGVDRRPSARVYPEDAKSHSHAWCFVCQERWDVFALWRKFNQAEEASFVKILGDIEKAYGLATPEMVEDAHLAAPEGTGDYEEFDALFEVTTRRLLEAKHAFRYLNDRVGYLQAGSVMDKLLFRVSGLTTSPTRGIVVLRELLKRISDKERQCPEG